MRSVGRLTPERRKDARSTSTGQDQVRIVTALPHEAPRPFDGPGERIGRTRVDGCRRGHPEKIGTL